MNRSSVETEPAFRGMERRPIAARQSRFFRGMADWLVRRGASPNAISLAGLVCGVTAGLTLGATASVPGWERAAWMTAALLIQLRLLSNLLDGMVAVAASRRSKLGELFNELPDRLSDAAILIGLGYAAGGRPEIGYLAAIAALLTAYVRTLGHAIGAPAVFAGPMAKQHRMALITVAAITYGIAPAWCESLRIATLAAGVCLVGSAATAVRRVALISGHLREDRS